MSTEPQRYDPIPIAGARREDVMEPVRDGDYVLFSDWEALRSERDSLKAQIKDMRGGLDECDGCGMLCGDGVLIDGRCQGCRSRL